MYSRNKAIMSPTKCQTQRQGDTKWLFILSQFGRERLNKGEIRMVR